MGRLLWSCLFLSCLLHHLQAASSSSTHNDLCHPDERSALLHFKGMFTLTNITDDYVECNSTSPKTAYWNKSSTDCCSWDGVTCDEFTSHVIGLDLSCSHLRGTMPPNTSLFRLSHLQRLNLAYNDFNGSTIPSGFGSQFPSLTHLNLSDANFLGLIPSEISHLSNLVSLDLSSYPLILEPHNFNMLLKNQTQIQELVLWGVNISSSIPDSIMNLSSLARLELGDTNLQGKLSNNIFHLPNLQYLSFDGNEALTGNLQEGNWSFSSSSLKELWLSTANLSGKLPDTIGNLKSLNVLDLQSCGLSGSIPRSMGNLTQIDSLWLAGNNFNNEDKGQLPDIFGKLVKLKHLDLSSNNFSAQFPRWVANLTQLTDLGMSSIALIGSIPSNISGLHRLKFLDLSNNLLNGSIPSFLFSLPSLGKLDLSFNRMTGPIPFGISGLQNLEALYLSNNLLNGPVPPLLFSLPSLGELDLSSNPLTGPIIDLYQLNTSTSPLLSLLNLSSCNIQNFPYFLRTFKSLKELDLSNNQIRGQIPKWIHKASSLYFLDLSHNHLEGSLLFLPSSLQFFSISHNKLTGKIPSLLCNLSSLTILNLSHNKLSGVIPQCLGNFSNYLAMLNLQMNAFRGLIPATFANGNSLRILNLNGNQLQGPVPQVLTNCKSLEVLDLGNNELNDTFPYWLESLPELQVLILHSNKFHGHIPTSRAKVPFPKLRIVDLSHNEFTGPLPSRYFQSFKAMMIVDENKIDLEYMGEYYYQHSVELVIKGMEIELMSILTIFTTIDFSDNHFTGEIPVVVGMLCSLRLLNLSHNNLNGHIPSSLGDLTMLESLDLSSNQFTGEIPWQLAKLTFLAIMNLSRNHLVGPIPQGNQFDTFANDSYGGNLALCGFPLSKKCEDDEASPQHQPPITFQQEDESNFFNKFNIWKATMMGYGYGIVLGLVVGYLIFSTGKPEWFIRVTEEEFFKKVRSSNKIGQRQATRRN